MPLSFTDRLLFSTLQLKLPTSFSMQCESSAVTTLPPSSAMSSWCQRRSRRNVSALCQLTARWYCRDAGLLWHPIRIALLSISVALSLTHQPKSAHLSRCQVVSVYEFRVCALTFHLSDIQMIITSLACIHSYKITTTTSYSDTICCSLLLLTVARLTRTCVSLLISHLPLFEMQISVVVQVGTRFFFFLFFLF